MTERLLGLNLAKRLQTRVVKPDSGTALAKCVFSFPACTGTSVWFLVANEASQDASGFPTPRCCSSGSPQVFLARAFLARSRLLVQPKKTDLRAEISAS